MVPLEAGKEVNEDGSSQDVADEGNGRLLNGKPWLPTVIAPYVPGFSKRLHSLSAKFGVWSWYSYGGKTRDSVCNFKDSFHYSKAQNSVYSVSCNCGTHYVGESKRNLKIWIHEHCLKSSKSTISLHVHSENEQLAIENLPEMHRINELSANVISQEKNYRKRRFMESVCIKSKSAKLSNTGGLVGVSDVWDLSLPHIAKTLKDLDWLVFAWFLLQFLFRRPTPLIAFLICRTGLWPPLGWLMIWMSSIDSGLLWGTIWSGCSPLSLNLMSIPSVRHCPLIVQWFYFVIAFTETGYDCLCRI